MTIEDPQIVNGLQTSTEIFSYFSSGGNVADDRNVLVRVVVPKETESADRIIKATNSQTSIPLASLRATDKIHRDIEEYMQPFGLFYDRRKNMHKNEGRPIEQIISIPLMAQAVMSVYLQRPNDARARPSSLLKKDDDYAKIFNHSHPVGLYLFAAKMIKSVLSYLKSKEELAAKDRNNLSFYVGMYAAALLAGHQTPNANTLSKIDPGDITKDVLDESYNEVFAVYRQLGESDQVAKGPQLLSLIKERLNNRLPKGPAPRVKQSEAASE